MRASFAVRELTPLPVTRTVTLVVLVAAEVKTVNLIVMLFVPSPTLLGFGVTATPVGNPSTVISTAPVKLPLRRMFTTTVALLFCWMFRVARESATVKPGPLLLRPVESLQAEPINSKPAVTIARSLREDVTNFSLKAVIGLAPAQAPRRNMSFSVFLTVLRTRSLDGLSFRS